MSFRRNGPVDAADTADAGLHELARDKVRRAMAALARPADGVEADAVEAVAVIPAEPDASNAADAPDDLVQQAIERLRQHVHSVAAVDHAGLPISEERLVRLVIGPLAERSRDADTAAALLAATDGLTPPRPTADVRPAPPTLILDGLLSEPGYRYLPAPVQPTGWPADPPARGPHIVLREARPA